MPKKKKPETEAPRTIEQEVDRLYPPPQDGWKPGDPYLHERVEWMRLREQRIMQMRELRYRQEREQRKQRSEGKRRCDYEGGCKNVAVGKTKYCENHAKECPECFERISKTEKFCHRHACEMCGEFRDIPGTMCAKCEKDFKNAEANHMNYEPSRPHPQALLDAQEAGI